MSKIEKLIEKLCPDGVEFKELGEIGEFYGGLTGKTKNDFSGGNAKFVTYMNIFSNITLNTNIDIFVKIGENEKQNKVEYGDVLFTGSSETPDECGMSSVLTEKITEPLYLNSFSFGFRLYNKDLLLPDFSKYLFREDNTRKKISQTASGVTRFNVSKKRFTKISIPIPPLPIQQEIVTILDTFTALDGSLQAELEARRKQYEHYRDQLLNFEGKDVEWKSLGKIADFRNGKGHEKEIVEKGKFIVVNSKFVSTSGKVVKYANNQICPLFKDDILIVMSDLPNGKALAKCFYVTENNTYTLNQRIGGLSIKNSNEIYSKFLFYILNRNKQLLKYDNGADQTNLRKDEILDIQIPIPAISEQKHIVSILDKFDALVNRELPAEIAARRKQYEYYREKLLSFRALDN